MFTSDINTTRRARRTLVVYAAITLFCGVFSFVYELFSHGVYSPYMICVFLFPLIGALPFLAVLLTRLPFPVRAAFNLYNTGVATLAVGSAVHGVFDIYGTSSPLVTIYWVAGGVCIFTAVLTEIVMRKRT